MMSKPCWTNWKSATGLSDERAATQIVHAKRSRFGAQRITHELRQKGIAEELISVALPALKETELAAAREVWQRKFGTLRRTKKKRRSKSASCNRAGFRWMRFSRCCGMKIRMIGFR